MKCISVSFPRTNAIFIALITALPAYILFFFFFITGHVIRKPGNEYKIYFYLLQELDTFIINLKENYLEGLLENAALGR